MDDQPSDAARAAVQRTDKRGGEISVAVLKGAPVQGLGPVPASRAAPAAQAARDRANEAVGLPPSRGLSAAERKRFGLDYRQGT